MYRVLFDVLTIEHVCQDASGIRVLGMQCQESLIVRSPTYDSVTAERKEGLSYVSSTISLTWNYLKFYEV